MNSINIIGNICNEIELKRTSGGKDVANFRIAVKRPYSRETTDFFTVVAWEKQAEVISKYAQKGKQIGISGVLISRDYQDKDGNKRTAIEILANNISFCSSKTEKNGNFEANSGISIKDVEVTPDIADFEEYADSDGLPF